MNNYIFVSSEKIQIAEDMDAFAEIDLGFIIDKTYYIIVSREKNGYYCKEIKN